MAYARLWTLTALAAFAATAAAEDPYGIARIRQLGTPGVERSWAVAVDPAGNVYISGATDGSLAGPSLGGLDAFLAKYDPSGALLWVRQFGTSTWDPSFAVAVDSAGNAYTAGWTGGPVTAGPWDAFLAKHDPSGELLWFRQFGTPGDDGSYAVAVDSAGNAYVGGRTWGSLGGPGAGGFDAFLAKYDPSGALLWTRQLGTPSSDWCYGVAVDNASNAYIVGATFGSLGGPKTGQPSDAFLAKYDPSGALLWVRQLGTPNPEDGYAVAVDSGGNAYITGSTYGDLAGPRGRRGDAFLAKYDPWGALLWVRQLSTPGIDHGYAVAVDSAGNPYISGWTAGGALLAKYNPLGDLLWTRQLGIPGGGEPSRGVAVDNAGNVYSTGHTVTSLGGPSAGDYDAFLARYSACPADCDGDGELTLADFLCFQSMFSGGGLGADCDGDGALTFFDFLCYQDAFVAGCA